MKFRTYLHENLKLELSSSVIQFKNGIYETSNKDEIEALNKVQGVYSDDISDFIDEINDIKSDNIDEDDNISDDLIYDVSSDENKVLEDDNKKDNLPQKKAGRPKKNK